MVVLQTSSGVGSVEIVSLGPLVEGEGIALGLHVEAETCGGIVRMGDAGFGVGASVREVGAGIFLALLAAAWMMQHFGQYQAADPLLFRPTQAKWCQLSQASHWMQPSATGKLHVGHMKASSTGMI